MISTQNASHADEEAIAQKYFEYSNNANFEGIAGLLHAEIMYASSTTGTYSGIESVLTMQKIFLRSLVRSGGILNKSQRMTVQSW